MAKKKISTIQLIFLTPISGKKIGIVTLLIVGILSFNVYALSLSSKQSGATVASLSQNDLQNVLGSSFSIGETKTDTIPTTQDPIDIYWNEIVSKHPSYRDAYIVMAIHAFNNRNCPTMKYYLDKAYTIDPNNPNLSEILPKIDSCLENSK